MAIIKTEIHVLWSVICDIEFHSLFELMGHKNDKNKDPFISYKAGVERTSFFCEFSHLSKQSYAKKQIEWTFGSTDSTIIIIIFVIYRPKRRLWWKAMDNIFTDNNPSKISNDDSKATGATNIMITNLSNGNCNNGIENEVIN